MSTFEGGARTALEIRVRGRVQGVGFRPTIFRLANELGLDGEVYNDSEGVLIRAAGRADRVAMLLERIESERPVLARIEAVETLPLADAVAPGFRIAESRSGAVRTEVAPDAVACDACLREVFDSADRRHRYPFTTCTHCGPRLSIVEGVPYDRSRTTMARFSLCRPCLEEYRAPNDRRFHAEPTACGDCGPKAWLEALAGDAAGASSQLDDVDRVLGLIERGAVVALKGLGGFQLACDATRADAVARLRERKRRDAKPFALMARDLDVVRRYCTVDGEEAAALRSVAGPIVLCRADGSETLPEAVAPGLGTLGFMLPTTPLHALVLRHADRPLVMTSGNLADEPQVTRDADARARLGTIADFVLFHDREIANRIDDSVVRAMDGRIRVLRRARGYAPSPIRFPAGFERAPALLAYGGDLKGTFCLLAGGEAILSQHQGDLEDLATREDYQKNLELYARLFTHAPAAIVHDRHPDYASTAMAREHARAARLPALEAQHHHAHVAACLAENGRALDAPPVLGIALDGLGLGEHGEIWGGEFLLADYRSFRRLATLMPVAMPGGDQAAREPWRNLYAQLVAALGWDAVAGEFGELELCQRLEAKPLALVDAMLRAGLQAPLASSCGRLFDAFAAAIGVAFERQAYEGQAGALLESLATAAPADDGGYPFTMAAHAAGGLLQLEMRALWRAVLADLVTETPAPVMAARFHRGLASALCTMTAQLARQARFDTVALSGGCFQNRLLFEHTSRQLRGAGFAVLAHEQVPPNDGGLALGQAAIAAATLLAR